MDLIINVIEGTLFKIAIIPILVLLALPYIVLKEKFTSGKFGENFKALLMKAVNTFFLMALFLNKKKKVLSKDSDLDTKDKIKKC